MKPNLHFLEEEMQVSNLGEEASVPDILSQLNIQNKTNFDLDEEDEIYEGYGKVATAYPYRQYTCYDRQLKKTAVKTAVLENDFVKAVFLPDFGGRLWRLLDKETDNNLLYTNDVIRPSNLSTRNAWFSGGVEWNIGIIGHNPLTMDALFAAELEDDKGNPILRMYEYERIRKVVYQMDFWLEENSKYLNCRMRIVNDSPDVIPMYWWSNMAVPEYENGRILVPAKEAFSSNSASVYKVEIPMVAGVDITKYNKIPDQIDYFFHIRETDRKYIANLNNDGYGLLHISTDRLQSRKLFSWGHNTGSSRWQEFLTENAGDYVEIQAGLGKTQYGCIPMAPHTAWEWMEQYGAVCVDKKLTECDFEIAKNEMNQIVEKVFLTENPEQKLKDRKEFAKKKGKLAASGSGYADLENKCRLKKGEKLLSEHLDFASEDTRQKEWLEFLEKGYLQEPDIHERPSDFTKDDIWFELLQNSTASKDKNNWYAHYQLGLQYLYRGNYGAAENELEKSCQMKENPWANHAWAVCCMRKGENEQAVACIEKAMEERLDDLSFIKDSFKILLALRAYRKLVDYYFKLDGSMRKEARIEFDYVQALEGLGQNKKARELLIKLGESEIHDIRECDVNIDLLWKRLCKKIYKDENMPIPKNLDFTALKE